MSQQSPTPIRDAWTVVAIVVALAIPLLLTLSTVHHPGELIVRSANPTPYGYTWSLGLWIVPLTVLVYWLHQSPGFHLPRLAFWRTIGGLSALGLLLDIVFGHTFFRFPNAGATLEVFIWSSGMSRNRARMSPRWATGTPTLPTSPRLRGSSLS